MWDLKPKKHTLAGIVVEVLSELCGI